MTATAPQTGSAAPRRRWSSFTWLGIVLLVTVMILGFLGAFITTMRVRSYGPVSVAADGMTNLDVDVDDRLWSLGELCADPEERDGPVAHEC